MKIKAGQILQAHAVLGKLIQEKRPLPAKGKYRITRLFTALEKEAAVVEEQRTALIKQFGDETFTYSAEDPPVKTPSGWQVPKDKIPEFQAEWLKIAEDVVEVACQAIPLSSIDSPAQVEVTTADGTKSMVDPISVDEMLLLGEFVIDDEVVPA